MHNYVVNRPYLEDRVRHLAGPITVFREYVFRDVLPAFNNIDARASEIGNEYYNRIARSPAGEYEIDLADVAENANQESYDWWEMMTSLRQSMLNLLSAGLFHLVEQQLSLLSRDGVFGGLAADTKLDSVKTWYQEELCIAFEALASWSVIDEMRLVANTVKHGEGSSAANLRKLNPALFVDPGLTVYNEEGVPIPEPWGEQRLAAPLSGDDFFVTEDILRSYAVSAEAVREIAAALRNQRKAAMSY